MFEFDCTVCGESHGGVPAFGWEAPDQYYDVPEPERAERVSLGSDDCVIDGRWFFVKGDLAVPVEGAETALVWGVWISLSEESFDEFIEIADGERRPGGEPFPGWLCTRIEGYPDTLDLPVNVRCESPEVRAMVAVDTGAEHALAADQRDGISRTRLIELCTLALHPEIAPGSGP